MARARPGSFIVGGSSVALLQAVVAVVGATVVVLARAPQCICYTIK